MARMRYFHDGTDGSVLLKHVTTIPNDHFAKRFPGMKGMRSDAYNMLMGSPAGDPTRYLPVTRRIEYKAFPSLHDCNGRCLNGKVNGRCECRCGGMNHGRGTFSSLLMQG